MKHEVVLLDADGVVMHAPEMFSERLAREHDIPDEDIIPFFTDIFVPYCLTGQRDLKEELLPWLSRWKWTGTVDELLTYWFEAEAVVDDQLTELIPKLREQGYTVALATNQEQHRTRYLREEMGFSELFDHVFSSAEMGHKKPSSAFYTHILEALGVRPNQVVYFDDEKENVQAAKKMGIDARVYAYPRTRAEVRGLLD